MNNPLLARTMHTAIFSAVSAASILLSGATQAQLMLEEVVVTAR
jgi:hypothetical protein